MLRFSTLTARRTHSASPLLNLGCGRRRHPAWRNADLAPDGPDVVGIDLRKPLPFSAGAFTAVYAAHVLEPGFGSGAAGLGLASVHRRIQAYYGDQGRLRIASAPVLGTSISVLLPVEPPVLGEAAA